MVLHFAHKVGGSRRRSCPARHSAHGDAHPSPGYPTRANQRCKKTNGILTSRSLESFNARSAAVLRNAAAMRKAPCPRPPYSSASDAAGVARWSPSWRTGPLEDHGHQWWKQPGRSLFKALQNTKATPRRPSLRFDACGLDEPGESDDLRATEHRQLRKGCKTVGHVLVLERTLKHQELHNTTPQSLRQAFAYKRPRTSGPGEGDK